MTPSRLNQQRYASARDAVCLGRSLLPHDHAHLRFSSQLVIGYGSGPVCSSREVGASCVTAPAPAGRPPAPPRYSRNPYGPQDLRPVEWYAQPWYQAPREVLP